ncbi:MAG: glycoside hydrolase family 10 protein, partial [Limisphaerales bacterium]
MVFALLSTAVAPGANYLPSTVIPPRPTREIRAAWVATVANIDWPSTNNLSTAQQKAELIGLLDRAVQLKLNTIIFQVRPACDAMYASLLEPWSEYLTGTMGKAPEPYYDPLAFAVEQAHRRGLELHAWFNPYRARQAQAKSPIAPNHISRTHPELVRHYGKSLWLDPGERAVQD